MKKTYDSKFKSRVALEAMRGELTIAEIASKYQIHPNQVQRWKQRLIEGASDIFASSSERKASRTTFPCLIQIGTKVKCFLMSRRLVFPNHVTLKEGSSTVSDKGNGRKP